MRTKFWLENLRVRGHSGDLGVDGRQIFSWILGVREKRCGLGSSHSGQGLQAIKGVEFLTT
jgi:hypothetical protein